MGNKRGLDLEHCTIVLKNLAKFHAISFAIFKGNSEAILVKYPYLSESFWGNICIDESESQVCGNFIKMFRQNIQMEKYIMTKSGHLKEAKILEEINSDKMDKRIAKLVSNKTQMASIVLGDCWTNNMRNLDKIFLKLI